MDTNGNYIQNQFCSYEIALKLKELGFDEISRFGQETSLYTKEGKHTFYANYGFMGSGLSGGYIYAPLWQQAIDWLREKHKIDIYPEPTYSLTEYSFKVITVHGKSKKQEYWDGMGKTYNTYQEAREQAILKAIELCQKEK